MRLYDFLQYAMYACFLIAFVFVLSAVIYGFKHGVISSKKELSKAENKALLKREKDLKEARGIISQLPDSLTAPIPEASLVIDEIAFHPVEFKEPSRNWKTEIMVTRHFQEVLSKYLTTRTSERGEQEIAIRKEALEQGEI